jgi:hypothetical protein
MYIVISIIILFRNNGKITKHTHLYTIYAIYLQIWTNN